MRYKVDNFTKKLAHTKLKNLGVKRIFINEHRDFGINITYLTVVYSYKTLCYLAECVFYEAYEEINLEDFIKKTTIEVKSSIKKATDFECYSYIKTSGYSKDQASQMRNFIELQLRLSSRLIPSHFDLSVHKRINTMQDIYKKLNNSVTPIKILNEFQQEYNFNMEEILALKDTK